MTTLVVYFAIGFVLGIVFETKCFLVSKTYNKNFLGNLLYSVFVYTPLWFPLIGLGIYFWATSDKREASIVAKWKNR